MDEQTTNVLLEMSKALGRIEQKQDSLHEALLGEGGRVTKIEEDIEWTEKKQWIHSAVIVPVTAALTIIAHRIKGTW